MKNILKQYYFTPTLGLVRLVTRSVNIFEATLEVFFEDASSTCRVRNIISSHLIVMFIPDSQALSVNLVLEIKAVMTSDIVSIIRC